MRPWKPQCLFCGGTGWVNIATKVRTCFACKGSGKA